VTVQTRIYVPLTAAALRGLSVSGVLEPAPLTGYAVTTDLRRANPGADDEELEYLAFTDATSADEAPVVAAADVDADVVTDLLDGGAATSAVRIARPVSRRQVASFHVADPDGTGSSPDYSWYDATELDVVLAALG
jgi:uncharacterized protein DUF6912